MVTEYTGEVVPFTEYTGAVVPVDGAPKVGAGGTASVMDRNPVVSGIGEAAANMVTGAGASVLGGIRGLAAGAGTLAGGGSFNDAADNATQVIQRTQADDTYQPRSISGQVAAKLASAPMVGAGIVGKTVGGAVGQVLGNRDMGESIGEVVPAVGATLLGGISAAKTGKAAVDSFMNSRRVGDLSKRIENAQDSAGVTQAAQHAKDLGIAVNPEDVNPTLGNVTRSTIAGTGQLDQVLALKNRPVWGKIAKRELGIDEGVTLTPKVYDDVRANASGSSAQIEALPKMVDDGAATAAIDSIRPPDIAGMEAVGRRTNGFLDNLQKKIDAGMTGEEVLTHIRQYRKSAKDLFKKDALDEMESARASAYIGAANTLEGLIDSTLTKSGDTGLLKQYRADRALQAKSYAYQAATDFNRALVDPAKIAKITKQDNALTGDIAKIGNIAGNLPNIAKLPFKEAAVIPEHISRAGVGGTMGALAGSFLGPVGAGVGGLLGATAGELGGMMMRRHIATDAFQQSGKTIPDITEMYSPLPNMLTGGTP